MKLHLQKAKTLRDIRLKNAATSSANKIAKCKAKIRTNGHMDIEDKAKSHKCTHSQSSKSKGKLARKKLCNIILEKI
jgi:hypothetical protein